MVFSEMKKNLFKILSIALSVSALVIIVINSVDIKTILTLMSIALVCKCIMK